MKPVFESKRIRFVAVSELLIRDYLLMVNDTERVGRLIGVTAQVEEEQERKWVRQKLEEKAPIFSMVEKKSGAFIGNIELMNVKDAEGELGIAITAGKQGLGYGTEAIPTMLEYGMRNLGLRRIFLRAFPDNARAIHVYEKCGFREYDRTAENVFMEITR